MNFEDFITIAFIALCFGVVLYCLKDDDFGCDNNY